MRNRACFIPAPPGLQYWSPGAVSVSLHPGIDHSDFPASVGGMLVVRLLGSAFGPDGQALPAAALIGPSGSPMAFPSAGPLIAHGLLLSPQAVMAITGVSNRWAAGGVTIDLDAVRPGQAHALRERLTLESTALARSDLLFDWLHAVVSARPMIRHRAIADIQLAVAIGSGLDPACRELGLGPRQLQRRCLDVFGMSPHRVYSVLRMRSVLRQALGEAAQSGGAELALNHRYYDQSHLARDLRRLAGAPLGRIVAASEAPDDALWTFNIGRQQFSSRSGRSPGQVPGQGK